MRRAANFRWILLLALLFSQGLAIAHAFDHELLDHRSHCTTCVHGQALDALPPAAESSVDLPAPRSENIEAPAAVILTRDRDSSRIRGPPSLI